MTPEALASLHGRCFPEAPWSVQAFRDLLATRATRLITDTSRQAFLLAYVIAPEIEILTLAVAPEVRRQGKARSLITQLLETAEQDQCTALFLEVAADNVPAVALYAEFGFAPTSLRKDYYRRTNGKSADAVIMACELSSGSRA